VQKPDNADPNRNHCGELNIHFSSIGKNISSKIDPPPTTFNGFLNESLPNLCTLPPTSAGEIRQIISSLKCKTTSNSYDIGFTSMGRDPNMGHKGSNNVSRQGDSNLSKHPFFFCFSSSFNSVTD